LVWALLGFFCIRGLLLGVLLFCEGFYYAC